MEISLRFYGDRMNNKAAGIPFNWDLNSWSKYQLLHLNTNILEQQFLFLQMLTAINNKRRRRSTFEG